MNNKFKIGDIICHKVLNFGELIIMSVAKTFYQVRFITEAHDGFSTKLYKDNLYIKCDNIFKENYYEN